MRPEFARPTCARCCRARPATRRARWSGSSAPLVSVGGVAPLAASRRAGIAIARGAAGVRRAGVVARARRRRAATAAWWTACCPGAPSRPRAAPGAPEVAAIGQRFEQAMQVLRRRASARKARLGWLRRPALRLRAAVVHRSSARRAPARPPRSSTRASSSRSPPSSAPRRVRGVGGTRNCDWWFTTDAVLIDTAGRYTTQDSDREADRAAWLGFLELLVRNRPRQPINGVLLDAQRHRSAAARRRQAPRACARDARAHRGAARASSASAFRST